MREGHLVSREKRRERIRWFLRVLWRPHPYAAAVLPWYVRWTEHLVGVQEAWRIAGMLSGQNPFAHPARFR